MAVKFTSEPRLSPVTGSGSGEALIERDRLLVSLLGDREAVRIICAPPLYGKTVLASQYARVAFEQEQVAWVHADSPKFLVGLDRGDSSSCEYGSGNAGALVVFDGVPRLTGARRQSFSNLLTRFHSQGVEVLVTTVDFDLAFDIQAPTVVLDAREMALSGEEVPRSLSGGGDVTAADNSPFLLMGKRSIPAVFLDREDGKRRFVDSLFQVCPSCIEEAVCLLALVLGKGRFSQLVSVFPDGANRMGGALERTYPHSGIKRASSEFFALPLGAKTRFDLLCAHLDALAGYSAFTDEQGFLMGLCALLRATDNASVMSWVLADLLSPEHRQEFYRSNGMDEVLDPCSAEEADDHQPSALRFSSSSTLRINLFGRCEITRDGRPVADPASIRKKAKVVIALLLVNYNKDVPRTWVERVVWPDSDPNCVRSSFYNLWSYVRKILSPSDSDPFALRASRDTVSLQGLSLESDVVSVDGLCHRLHGCDDPAECHSLLSELERLYVGPLLPGIENEQLEAYRAMYRNRVLDALVDGVRILVRGGELRSAQRFAAFAFEIDQTREDVVYLYMKVQKMLGQFAGAISTFFSCRHALVERFGIDESSRLEALYQEILCDVSKK